MTLSLLMDNQVVDVLTPQQAQTQRIARLDIVEGRPAVAATSRFNIPGTYGSSQPAENIRSTIPGDAISATLPIPCFVDWSFSQISIGPSKTWQRAAKMTVPWDKFWAAEIFIPGSIVQFRDQLRGHEDNWYEIVSISPDKPTLALQPGSIVCDLKERGSPHVGLNDNG